MCDHERNRFSKGKTMEKLTYKQQYLNWLEKEKLNGLKGFHFSINEEFVSNKSKQEREEEFYKELMEMINAPVTLPDIVSIYKAEDEPKC